MSETKDKSEVSKSKHTPGPWNVYQPYKYEIHIRHGNDVKSIATIGSLWHVDFEANARLVASAPELLEACKDGLSIAYESGLDDSDGVVKRMKAAIAKAEGGK